MPTGLTYKIAEGSAATLPEIVDQLIRGFVFDFRDADQLTPLAKHRDEWDERVADAEKDVQCAFDAIHALEGLSDADLETEQIAAWEKHATAYADYRARDSAILTRYDAALAKLKAWTPPPELEDMRQGFIRHLNESKGHDTYDWTTRPKPEEPGSEIRKDRRAALQQIHARALETLEKVKTDRAKSMAFYTALHAELERIKNEP